MWNSKPHVSPDNHTYFPWFLKVPRATSLIVDRQLLSLTISLGNVKCESPEQWHSMDSQIGFSLPKIRLKTESLSSRNQHPAQASKSRTRSGDCLWLTIGAPGGPVSLCGIIFPWSLRLACSWEARWLGGTSPSSMLPGPGWSWESQSPGLPSSNPVPDPWPALHQDARDSGGSNRTCVSRVGGFLLLYSILPEPPLS